MPFPAGRIRWWLAIGWLATLQVGCGESARQKGQRLFIGEAPLTGRITGHGEPLPAGATRCINCHAAGTPTADTTNSFGPGLSAASLQTPSARRGGPPSRFDAQSLCRLLRTGTDPAYIVIAQAMPRYSVSDEDCDALWAFLMSSDRV